MKHRPKRNSNALQVLLLKSFSASIFFTASSTCAKLFLLAEETANIEFTIVALATTGLFFSAILLNDVSNTI